MIKFDEHIFQMGGSTTNYSLSSSHFPKISMVHNFVAANSLAASGKGNSDKNSGVSENLETFRFLQYGTLR